MNTRKRKGKVPAVRGVSRGREDGGAAEDLVLHMVVLWQSQGVVAVASMQS